VRAATLAMALAGVVASVLAAVPAAARPASVQPAGTTDRVVLSAAADYGLTRATRATLAEVGRTGGQLHLALGDLAYRDATEREWCAAVTRRVGSRFPFQLLAGNHESDGRDGHIDRFVQCLPNRLPGLVGRYGRQWYVDVPAADPLVRLVLVSAGLRYAGRVWRYAAGSDRYRWTARAIDGARAAGIPWVVVGAHLPCLSMGRYGCGMGRDLANMLVAKRVDLVLTGHEHLYQRTKQLALGPGCTRLAVGTADPACIAGRGDTLRAGDGTVMVTAGTGGTRLRALRLSDPERRYFAAWSAANVRPRHGFVRVTATPTRLALRFVGTTSGGLDDSVTLTR
jgi:hypothetical protein